VSQRDRFSEFPKPKYRHLAAGVLALLIARPALPDNLPMWEIAGAHNTIRLLGSIHFLRPGRDSLPPALVAAVDDADVVLMELDLDDLDQAGAQVSLQTLGIDPGGRTLEALLGERDYRLAATKANALGIDLALLQAFEPWLAAITVSQIELQKLGFDSESGVERQVLQLAARDRKEVRGLETLQEQLAAMDALPPATQRAFLLQTLDEAADMREQIDDIVEAWKTGDVRTMESEFLDDVRKQPDLYRRIVVDRNRAWARKIGALTRERTDYLVVVGTLHLVGPDSLVRMLDKAGHTSRQLTAADMRN
jgi:hypothetical protein